MEKEKLVETIHKHYKWLKGEKDGERADLRGADLRGADLRGTDLRGADLSSAILIEADLRGADIRGTNLTEAILRDANFKNVVLDDETEGLTPKILNSYFPISCPEYGEFIGWKITRGPLIVKLKITENAKRSSAFGRKCRCSEAVVLAIENIDGTPSDKTEATSTYDISFIYRVGETVRVSDFDDNRARECAPGIHFFITRQEAVDYGA